MPLASPYCDKDGGDGCSHQRGGRSLVPFDDGVFLRQPHVLQHDIDKLLLQLVDIGLVNAMNLIDAEKAFVQVVVGERGHKLSAEGWFPNVQVGALHMSFEVTRLRVEFLMRVVVLPTSLLGLFRVVRADVGGEMRRGLPRFVDPGHDEPTDDPLALLPRLVQPACERRDPFRVRLLVFPVAFRLVGRGVVAGRGTVFLGADAT
mmetsp:Transcript_6998/g.13815  ORF Transcript_6998/g.13815 Transcript_6998/m.13815 type:complete len:204 (+) Transcript_6998:353-964(+)